jgi:uncharacterized membrane-anchored protein
MAVVISFITIRDDMLSKGYKPDALDGDNDGIIQEGTKWERKVLCRLVKGNKCDY